MSQTLLEARPALKHLMSTVQQSSRALKRLMREARDSGDPAPVLRTALSEASVVSKAAVRLAIEIGRIHETNPQELQRRKPPKYTAEEVLARVDVILRKPLIALEEARQQAFQEVLKGHPAPREAFEHVGYTYTLGGFALNWGERLELLEKYHTLTTGEAIDLAAHRRKNK